MFTFPLNWWCQLSPIFGLAEMGDDAIKIIHKWASLPCWTIGKRAIKIWTTILKPFTSCTRNALRITYTCATLIFTFIQSKSSSLHSRQPNISLRLNKVFLRWSEHCSTVEHPITACNLMRCFPFFHIQNTRRSNDRNFFSRLKSRFWRHENESRGLCSEWFNRPQNQLFAQFSKKPFHD